MSERTTGATDAPETPEQLIAWSIESETGYDPIWCRGLARQCVQSLTSNGLAIAPAADVLKPYHVSVDIDDLRLVLGNQTVYSADDDDLHQAICRLEAIADGGAV